MNKLFRDSIERLLAGHDAQSAVTWSAQAAEPDGFFDFAATRRSIRAARTGWLTERLEERMLLSGYVLSQIGSFGANASGGHPESTLVADSNGNLYGTASDGGASGNGTVFEIANGSGTITTLASFNGTNGEDPEAGVTLDASGNLFGTTSGGGSSNEGTVFEIAKGSDTITAVASFNGTNGGFPEAAVTLDASGNLYGTTSDYSAWGTVFEIAKGSGTITALASFDGTNGGDPSGVTLDASGNLYGTNYLGGSSNEGTVFEIAKGSSTITALASFNGTDGENPVAGVTLDASGNLYGMTTAGGPSGDGTVFEIAKGSSTITTLASFDGTNGENPRAGATLDAPGNLYGTTEAGGASGDGTVFEIAKGSSTVTTLVSFDGSNGDGPYAGVTLDASGNLYGTTEGGGASNDGAVFEIAEGSNTIATLASFDATNGAYPSGLMLDASGNLYGTASGGGTSGDGTVFEIANGSGTITTLASFNGTNGAGPISVTLDASGNLFGTTYDGGASNDGTVFEIAKGSGTITTLASFDGTNGLNPEAGVTLDASGNLYGTTVYGGASFYGGTSGIGTVFEIAKGSGTITTLASFNGTDGAYPTAGVTLDASGNLYGTTEEGGPNFYFGVSGEGTVFEIANGSSTITTLAYFNGTDGGYPEAGVTLDPSGNLYGTTQQGGASNDGIVFEIAKGSVAVTTLVSFNGTNGNEPLAGVTLDASGNLYGTTYLGGPINVGTVFELATNTVVIFSPSGGSNPSNSTEPLTFTAAVSDGVPNGETLTLEDASNNDAVLASGIVSNAFATLTVPAGMLTAGTHNLIVVYGGDANFGASESAPYTQTVLPGVTGISPSSGPAAGGTTVTITGTGFTGATAVDFGSTPASSFTVNNDGSITAVDPAGSGTVDVTVVTPGGTTATSSADQFTYTATPVSISSVVVNGNNSALAGVQRSMVNSIEYTFAQAVILNQTNAFSLAVHSGQSGTVPTLTWTAVNPDASGGSTQWVVSFSGAGVSSGSIANGVYDITLNAAGVSGESGGTLASSRTDTFYRLFGDAQGTKNVSTADYNAFLSTNGLKSTAPGYLAEFAADGSGKIDTSDYNAFLADLGKKLTGFTPTI